MQDGLSREQSGKSGATITQTLLVGTNPVQIPFYICKSVYFESDANNTDFIYVGNGPQVTKNTGTQIAPNGGVGWGSDSSDRFWAVSNSGTQVLYCIISNSGESIQRSGGNPPASPSGLSSVKSFQQAATTGAVALTSNVCTMMIIKCDDASTVPIYVGGSGVTTSTGFQLQPGQGISINVLNTNDVYIVGTGSGGTADVIWG